MKIKSFVSILVGVLLIGTMSACGSTVPKLAEPSTNVEDSQSVITTLTKAETIKVKKEVISFGDKWTVYADDVETATIEGQAIPLLGDTYNMFTLDGNLVGSEVEKVFKVLPGAEFYDYQNELQGSLQQELTFLFQKFTLYDVEDNVLVTAEQKFDFTLNFDIMSTSDEVQYKVKKAFLSWGDTLEIEKVAKDPTISGVNAVWFTVIANELNNSSNDESSKNKK